MKPVFKIVGASPLNMGTIVYEGNCPTMAAAKKYLKALAKKLNRDMKTMSVKEYPYGYHGA